MEYKRLTKRNANGEVETVKRPKSSYIQEVYEEWDEINRELKLRLAELEDKIEAGTLIEIPCKVGDNAVAIIDTLCYPNAIYNVKLKDLAYIVEDENGDVTFQHITRIFGTKAEAEKRLEEIRNEKKSIDSSGK
jgi:hypothetical protein